jgi:hypothetical protein
MGRWVETTDIEKRFRPMTGVEKAAADEFIDDAEQELIERVANLAARIESGEVSQRRVYRIVCDAVIAVLRNPDGFITRSETRGPFSFSGTRAADAVATKVTISESDLASLRPTVSPVGAIPLGLQRWQVP